MKGRAVHHGGRARGEVALKDMKTGGQRTLKREQAGASIGEALNSAVK